MAKQRVILLCVGLAAVAFAAGHYSARLSPSIAPASYRDFVRALESRDWALRAHVMSGFVVGLGPENLAPAVAQSVAAACSAARRGRGRWRWRRWAWVGE